MRKIKRIETDGHVDTRRVAPWDYKNTIADFRTGNPSIELPSWHSLRDIGDQRALWILMSPVVVTIHFVGGGWWQYKFDRGFIWDQASVPIFKDDILEAVIPAMCHDGNFSQHFVTFEETNKLFFRMLRKFGMNPIRAAVYYLAVNSMFGRAIWEKNQRQFWHGKTVHFMSDR